MKLRLLQATACLALAFAFAIPAKADAKPQNLLKDFNQDRKTDILWYQPSSGRVNAWLLNGTKVVGNPDLNWNVPGDSGWEAKGTGDFNQDGKTDILWYQPSSGRVNTWLLDGTKVVSNPDLSWKVPGDSGWEIKGTGDFNQDGKTDILWYQPSSGRVNAWLLDGTKVVSNPDLSWNVPGDSGWEIKGTGDFNQDGKTDILWYQPSSGRVNAWLLDGTKVVSNPDLSWNVPGDSGWEIKGTGDFNQDRKTDILWYQPSSGRVNAWLLDGTKVVSNPDLSWKVPGDSGWDIVSR